MGPKFIWAKKFLYFKSN